MATTVMVATVSLDGFIADHDDTVGELFDWYGVGDVEIAPGDPQRSFHVGRSSANWVAESFDSIGAAVIGRHLFDYTNGWDGRPAAGDVGGQAFAAGLVDEVELALAPVVFGTGKRFFGDYTGPHVVLEDPHVAIAGQRVTHLRYRSGHRRGR